VVCLLLGGHFFLLKVAGGNYPIDIWYNNLCKGHSLKKSFQFSKINLHENNEAVARNRAKV